MSAMGATSGEKYQPRKLRNFEYSKFHQVEELAPSAAALSDTGVSCSRWLVTTTINPATPNLQAFAQLEGWCKVFVLDRKSPPDFVLSGPGVVVLAVADQEALPWRTARLLPWNHFGRKNLGYLYALLHGADIIYDTDDDNFIETSSSGQSLLPASLDEDHSGESGGLQLHMAPLTNDGAFNPYPFWRALDAWPRGFPLSLINTITAKTGATRVTSSDASVLGGQRTCMLQSLANVDPDMDGIFRLTHPLPLYFPTLGARLMYPAGVYAPANAQATLLSREVAAALLMPVTVHGRVSDIWRSYILQRVMWDSGCRLTFADPWVTQYRNAHGYLKDFQAELDLYLKAEGMLEVLGGIDFGNEMALGPRVLTTFIRLYEYGLIEDLDVRLAYAYLRDLSLLDPVDKFAARGAPTATQAADAAPAQQLVPAPASSNRAVVCLTGMFRGGPFTLPLLRTNVLEALGMPFDIVVSTPDLPDGNLADFLYLLPNLRAVHYPDYSNVSALAALDWSETALSPDSSHSPTKWVSQLTDLSACNAAIRKTETKYTHAVRVRADTLVMNPLPLPPAEVPPHTVVVPDNEDFGGVNDRFAYGRIEDMSVLFDLIAALPGILPRAPHETKNYLMWNAERMYGVHAADNGIIFDKRPIQLCRLRAFRGGALGMDGHDFPTFPVCSQYCLGLKSCHARRRAEA